MSDLIDRLRGYASDQGRHHNVEDACVEAADEIERLTEALAWYADPANHKAPSQIDFDLTPILQDGGKRARLALEGRP